jgi:hypothetical protein
VHEKLANSVVGRHGDGRSRFATALDRGRVVLVVEAETDRQHCSRNDQVQSIRNGGEGAVAP